MVLFCAWNKDRSSAELRLREACPCKSSNPPAAWDRVVGISTVSYRDSSFGASSVRFSKRLLRLFSSGYRNRGSGSLNEVGTWGGSWSSSPNASGSANASHLNFNASNVNPLNSTNRANGLPVRCVKYLRFPARKGSIDFFADYKAIYFRMGPERPEFPVVLHPRNVSFSSNRTGSESRTVIDLRKSVL